MRESYRFDPDCQEQNENESPEGQVILTLGQAAKPRDLGRQNRAAMERMLELCSSDRYIDRGTPFTVEEYFEGAMAGV